MGHKTTGTGQRRTDKGLRNGRWACAMNDDLVRLGTYQGMAQWLSTSFPSAFTVCPRRQGPKVPVAIESNAPTQRDSEKLMRSDCASLAFIQ